MTTWSEETVEAVAKVINDNLSIDASDESIADHITALSALSAISNSKEVRELVEAAKFAVEYNANTLDLRAALKPFTTEASDDNL